MLTPKSSPNQSDLRGSDRQENHCDVDHLLLAQSATPSGFRALGRSIPLEVALDSAGTGFSMLCTAKCIGVPVAAALLPAAASVTQLASSPVLHNPMVHWGFLIAAAPLAVSRLIVGALKSGQNALAGLSAAALVLMGWGASDAEHHLHGTSGHHLPEGSKIAVDSKMTDSLTNSEFDIHLHSSSEPHLPRDSNVAASLAISDLPQRNRLVLDPDPICSVSSFVAQSQSAETLQLSFHDHKPDPNSTISAQPSNSKHVAFTVGGLVLGIGHVLRLRELRKTK